MKTALILALVALAGTAIYLLQDQQSNNLRSEEPIFREFQNWMTLHGKTFDNVAARFENFKANKKIVEEANQRYAAEGKSLRLGMNKFAALTLQEFVEQYVSSNLTASSSLSYEEVDYSNKTAPASINWVAKGAVAPVEDQGQCGSCWAFSTKEGLEGVYQINTGNLVVFSAQQLVDCSRLNFGCSGGDPMNAYSYTSNNGIESEASYPYVSGTTKKRQDCQYDASKVVFTNSGSVKVSPQKNTDAIIAAAAEQPLTIEVSAGNVAFQLYQTGVITSDACGTALDHGVLLTGYDTTASTPYWTIKNSWGTGWGEKGYGNIELSDANNGKGVCGINQYAAYPKY